MQEYRNMKYTTDARRYGNKSMLYIYFKHPVTGENINIDAFPNARKATPERLETAWQEVTSKLGIAPF